MADIFKLVVLTNAVESRDDEFNSWYSDVHLNDVLKVEGFAAAQRFRLVELVDGEVLFRCCAVYEIECDDPHDALERLKAVAGTSAMEVSSALATPLYAGLYEPIGPEVRA